MHSRAKSVLLKISLVFLVILASLGLAWGIVRAAQEMEILGLHPQRISFEGIQQTQSDTAPAAVQTAIPAVPEISFIQSPDAACVQPEVGSNTCYITWSYLYVEAAPNYIITMTVEIDSKRRASYHGFFQQSIYVPTEMLSLQVVCGKRGSGGKSDMGMQHAYTIRARDTANLGSANYGSVLCPAFIPKHIYIPFLKR